jgi:hypothetical protein
VALRGRCAPGHRLDYQVLSLACTSRAVKAPPWSARWGTPGAAAASARPRSDRDIAALSGSYDNARTHYESLVPEADSARCFQMASWQATLDLADINAPHGFMRYFRMDITALMAGSPSFWQATQYLMGNHTIAERMFRHDPSVMLHAPLRTLLYADADGATKFAVDQPSLLFASYDNPEIAAVGHELDALITQLINLLGAQVPSQLAAESRQQIRA